MAGKIIASLSALLTLDPKGFNNGVKSAKKNANGLAGSIGKIGPAMVAAFSTAAIVSFSRESYAAYQSQLTSEAKLQTALKGRKDVADALIRQANNLQKVTLFSDEDIINGQAILAMYTDNEQALKQLTPLILDYAQAFGIDVAQAAKQVGKVLISTEKTIGRTGFVAEGAAGSAERLNSVIGLLGQNFNGQAVAAVTDEMKGMREAAVAVDEFKEAWGELVAQAANSGALSFLVGMLENLQEVINKISDAKGLGKLWEVAKWIGMGSLAGTAIETAIEGNGSEPQDNSAYNVPAADLGVPGVDVKKTAEELEEEAKLKKQAQDQALKDYIEYTKRMQAIAEEDLMIAERNAEIKRNIMADAGADLRAGWEAEAEAAARREEFSGTLAKQAEEAAAAVERLSDAYRDEANVADEIDTEKIAKKFIRNAEVIISANEAIQQSLQALAADVTSTFSQMIEAFAAGEEVNFGEMILSMIGNFMKTLGTAFISIGAMGKLFDTALKSMQWEVALAAGVALLAAGSLVSGLAKKGAKMADGGVVPAGYPNDTYPALLSSNEMVIPPHKLDSVMGGGQVVVMDTRVKGEDLYFVQKKVSSKRERYT